MEIIILLFSFGVIGVAVILFDMLVLNPKRGVPKMDDPPAPPELMEFDGFLKKIGDSGYIVNQRDEFRRDLEFYYGRGDNPIGIYGGVIDKNTTIEFIEMTPFKECKYCGTKTNKIYENCKNCGAN